MLTSFAGSETVDPEARLEALCMEVMPVISRRKRARFARAIAARSNLPPTRRFLACARNLGFRLSVWAQTCSAYVRMALEMAAASVALDDVAEGEISDLAKSRTIASLQPASGRCEGGPYAHRVRIGHRTGFGLRS